MGSTAKGRAEQLRQLNEAVQDWKRQTQALAAIKLELREVIYDMLRFPHHDGTKSRFTCEHCLIRARARKLIGVRPPRRTRKSEFDENGGVTIVARGVQPINPEYRSTHSAHEYSSVASPMYRTDLSGVSGN
jgi:hypothetical protein